MSSRRLFITRLLTVGAAVSVAPLATAQSFTEKKIKVLAFDAFPVFDPRPVFALAEELFPGKGQELSNVWRIRQFEYQWLRALSGTYKNFGAVTEDALVYAAASAGVVLTEDKRRQLMDAWTKLPVWPDVLPALRSLKAAGYRLVFLSNMTEEMLRENMSRNQLDNMFAAVYSTDKHQCYKPDKRAYQIAIDGLRLKKEEIAFVAFAGWDAAGAKAFGYTTYWVNRQHQQPEELGAAPDWIGDNLEALAKYLGN